jgi:hypothetical protein
MKMIGSVEVPPEAFLEILDLRKWFKWVIKKIKKQSY